MPFTMEFGWFTASCGDDGISLTASCVYVRRLASSVPVHVSINKPTSNLTTIIVTSSSTEVLAKIFHSWFDIPFEHLTKHGNPVSRKGLDNFWCF